MRGFFLGAQQQLCIWAFSAVYIPCVIALSLVTFGWLLRRYGRPISRFWARACLWFMRVRLDVDGYERLSTGLPQLATFNHASTLDAFILWGLMPDRGLPIIKREMLYYPILGLGMIVLDVIALDRRDPERAKASIDAGAKRMVEEGLTVFIAPEGRRSRDGALRPFKLGVCRLAVAANCPIVPIVIHNGWELLPTGRYYAEPGTLRIQVLEPVSTQDWTKNNMAESAERLHDVYAKALGVSLSASATREAS